MAALYNLASALDSHSGSTAFLHNPRTMPAQCPHVCTLSGGRRRRSHRRSPAPEGHAFRCHAPERRPSRAGTGDGWEFGQFFASSPGQNRQGPRRSDGSRADRSWVLRLRPRRQHRLGQNCASMPSTWDTAAQPLTRGTQRGARSLSEGTSLWGYSGLAAPPGA